MLYLFNPTFVISQPFTSNEGQKRMMHKAMSSGDLGKSDSLRKISHGDGRSESYLFYFFLNSYFSCASIRMNVGIFAQGSGQDEVLGKNKAG